jgi:hypothetical protein
MTLREQYDQACNPTPGTILGFRLRPFSRGHHEILSEEENSAEEITTPAELIFALRVCSLRYSKARQYMVKGGWNLRSLFALVAMRLRPALFHTGVQMFKAYAAHEHLIPGFWSDTQKTHSSSCPPSLMARRDLMHYFGYAAEAINDLPYARVEWERLAMMEAEGALNFIDTDTLAQAKAMARQHAEEEAAANGSR